MSRVDRGNSNTYNYSNVARSLFLIKDSSIDVGSVTLPDGWEISSLYDNMYLIYSPSTSYDQVIPWENIETGKYYSDILVPTGIP